MNTKFDTLQQALKQLDRLNTGTIVDINGRVVQVVRAGGFTTFRSMAVQPAPVQRPDDGRTFHKVHMSMHKIANAIVGG